MPYLFLEDVAIADVAFEAWEDTPEALFVAAAEATMNVMVGDLNTIVKRTLQSVQVVSEALDLLLFNFLQEIIFYKDAQRLLLRAESVRIERGGEGFLAFAELAGEVLDMDRHDLVVDVKAVTLHQFQVEVTERGWEAFVILDI